VASPARSTKIKGKITPTTCNYD